MTRCPACGSEVGSGAVKCLSCGTQLAGGTAQMPNVGGGVSDALVPAEVVASEQPSFVVVKGPDTGERFAVDRDELTIGRGSDRHIFLNDVTVSREHAIVTVGEGAVHIADAGSLNGTYVNGDSIEEAELVDGDHVQIGRFLLVFFAGSGGS